MGPTGSKNAAEVDYTESLFTVEQLYQLCSACGMLSDGGSNRADTEGWVVTNGAKGCIHPPKEIKEQSGEAICTERHMLQDADNQCNVFDKTDNIQAFWYDSCLAEMCNTGDSAGVHEVVAAIHDMVDADDYGVDMEYADF